MKRTPQWHARQLAHMRAALAEANKQHTQDELIAAEMALAEAPSCPQRSLFSLPPNAGLIPGGQPEPSGLADTGRDLGD